MRHVKRPDKRETKKEPKVAEYRKKIGQHLEKTDRKEITGRSKAKATKDKAAKQGSTMTIVVVGVLIALVLLFIVGRAFFFK